MRIAIFFFFEKQNVILSKFEQFELKINFKKNIAFHLIQRKNFQTFVLTKNLNRSKKKLKKKIWKQKRRMLEIGNFDSTLTLCTQ